MCIFMSVMCCLINPLSVVYHGLCMFSVRCSETTGPQKLLLSLSTFSVCDKIMSMYMCMYNVHKGTAPSQVVAYCMFSPISAAQGESLNSACCCLSV